MVSNALGVWTTGLSLLIAGFCLAGELPIHAFKKADGLNPNSALLPDGKGGFYGTAPYGGTKGGSVGRGTVFHLTPPDGTHPSWTLTVLHSFGRDEGNDPQGVVLGKDGALYGTAAGGGLSGYGTVFRLAPPAQGQTKWIFSLIFTFYQNNREGSTPFGNLLVGADGSLYGMTEGGGGSYYGVIYRLSPPTGGSSKWKETVLHEFDNIHGASPFGGLTGDPQSTMYGATTYGGNDCGSGSDGCGTVFQISAPSAGGGAWNFQTLYAFKDRIDGEQPSPVILGPGGVLYGTTEQGGGGGIKFSGQVFSLTPPTTPGGEWTKTELHAFTTNAGGYSPSSAVLLGQNGVLYGNTYGGGKGFGLLFKLTPPMPGATTWRYTPTHLFGGAPDGDEPLNNPLTLVDGVLFGETRAGGDPSCQTNLQAGCGVAYMIPE